MITLYTFGPMFELPDPSPFVMKAEVLLKMGELALSGVYVAVSTSSPKGSAVAASVKFALALTSGTGSD